MTLWASPLHEAVRGLLRRRFPRLTVIEHPEHAAVAGTAFEAALTVAGARFIVCRDTASLGYLRGLQLRCPVQEFAPDGTFALDIRDDRAAESWLAAHGLEPGRFLCVVPRLRWTPYANRVELARQGCAFWTERLREAIVAFVRATGQRVLLCPEMTYQVPLLRPLLFDALPDDVTPAVVSRDAYWYTDEAASTYARATAAIHFRQPTDTRKGQMWRDIGLDHWLL